jgi:hypothetical protein
LLNRFPFGTCMPSVARSGRSFSLFHFGILSFRNSFLRK